MHVSDTDCLISVCPSLRHPDKSSRPQFLEVGEVLSLPEHELLSIPEEEGRVHPQATLLGAPLEAGKQLYLELQKSYIQQ